MDAQSGRGAGNRDGSGLPGTEVSIQTDRPEREVRTEAAGLGKAADYHAARRRAKEKAHRDMRSEASPGNGMDSVDGRRKALTDDEKVIRLSATCTVRWGVDDTANKREEARGSKLLGRHVEVPSDDPRPLEEAEAAGNLIKDGEIGRVGGPDDIMKIN